MNYKLEIIAFNIESCLIVEQSGAHRIELCDNPMEGGTTPSFGMIKAAREKVSIELFPMIRPRGGDFLYSEDEFAIMIADVKLCKDAGCDGVVFGILEKGGSIDKRRTAKLVELAYPMEVTFHRAFDKCKEPFEAMEQLIETGCKRILTSGQQINATEGADLIAQLIKIADDRIIIMPGSGVRADNIQWLAQKTGAVEFHSSLRSMVSSKMDFIHPAFAQNTESYTHPSIEAEAVIEMLNKLNGLA